MFKTAQSKPLLIFGTRHGSVYNLTPSNLPELPAIQLSFGDFFDNKETLRQLPEGLSFKRFLGFKQNIVTYLTPYDFYKQQPITGCQNSKQVKIKCANGYNPINAHQYDEVAQIIKPDILVTLTDYPSLSKNHKQESNKSYKRAINKTTSYLEQSKSKNLKGSLRFAAVHGAKNLALVSRSMEQIFMHENVDGLVVCDICEQETIEEREVIFNHISERLKQESKQYILALAGKGKIEDIEHARQFGYTHFEVSYPFMLAEKHVALIKQGDKYVERVPVKHENLEPLDRSCGCEACTRHSESYIAHLIECHEMTASVLLTIHNIHVYTDYLSSFNN